MDDLTVKDIHNRLAAGHLAFQYSFAMLIIALGEKQAVEPRRVFEFFKVITDGLDSGSVLPIDVAGLASEQMKGIETTFLNMITMPPGAGRA
jgi:hypothetical protein